MTKQSQHKNCIDIYKVKKSVEKLEKICDANQCENYFLLSKALNRLKKELGLKKMYEDEHDEMLDDEYLDDEGEEE